MIRVTLPFGSASHQALTAFTSFVVTALSATLTVAAACKHWPAALPFAVATALACELCKITLFRTGIITLRTATTWRVRTAASARVALACLFATLSVGASIMCMSQAEESQQAQTLYDSRAYTSAKEKLRGIDQELTTLRASAAKDTANTYTKRALATLDRIQAVKLERSAAEAQLAALEQHPAPTTSAALPHALSLAGITAPLASVNFVLELIIGSAIEIAGLLFLCGTHAHPAQSQGRGPESTPPPTPLQPRRTRKGAHGRLEVVASAPVLAIDGTAPAAAASLATATNKAAGTPAPIPATYAKWLRFSFGRQLDNRLLQLESERCYGACRDLLHRMGDHCLRDGWTNGIIDTATIRQHLRGGRDWRTIEGYLARLMLVGALSRAGSLYTIAHFLEANPSVERRNQQLAEKRAKVCKRQRKVRERVQTLQPQPVQQVDLTASPSPRHAQKPQPTTHADEAAHAATHHPTDATPPHSCDSVGQSEGGKVPHRRSYGAVKAPVHTDADDQAWFRQLAAIEARGARPGSVSADDATAAANDFESTLSQSTTKSTQSAEQEPQGQDERYCIAVRIPPNTPPVNLHDVEQACLKIGIPGFGRQFDALFHRLNADAVHQAELAYAAWCTKHAIDKGNLRKSAVGLLLDIIRRQRLQAVATRAA